MRKFNLKDKVRHNIYGEGVIVACFKNWEDKNVYRIVLSVNDLIVTEFEDTLTLLGSHNHPHTKIFK